MCLSSKSKYSPYPFLLQLSIDSSHFQISEDDVFSKNICNECLEQLRIAHRFRKKCLESDRILQRGSTKRKLSRDIVSEAAILANLDDGCIEVVYEKNTDGGNSTDGESSGGRSKRKCVNKSQSDYMLDFDEIERTLEEMHAERVDVAVKTENSSSSEVKENTKLQQKIVRDLLVGKLTNRSGRIK